MSRGGRASWFEPGGSTPLPLPGQLPPLTMELKGQAATQHRYYWRLIQRQALTDGGCRASRLRRSEQ